MCHQVKGEKAVYVSVPMCSVFAGDAISANLHGKVVNLRIAFEASSVELLQSSTTVLVQKARHSLGATT